MQYMLLAILLLTSHAASAKKLPCPDISSPYLQACDGKLYLKGKEYRAVGVNFYTAFRLYLDQGWDGVPKGEGRIFARRGLEDLSAHDIPIIRVMGPFHPWEFQEVFFDKSRRAQRAKRKKFFATLNVFLDDWKGFVVYDLMWNPQNLADLGGHSLREGITDPISLGYRRFEEFALAVVKHCRKRPRIIFGIGNEYNLFADLRVWFPQGVFENTLWAKEQGLYRGPDNNFNSLELAAFFKRAIASVKRVAPNHLVVTGNTEPRPDAIHRMRAVLGSTEKIENDSPEEREAAMILLESSADLVSSHYYINEQVGVAWYQRVAQRLGKPLFMGEVGPHFSKVGDVFVGADYADPAIIKAMGKKSMELVEAGTAISLLWTYDCRKDGDRAFRLCYGTTDATLRVGVELPNQKIQNTLHP